MTKSSGRKKLSKNGNQTLSPITVGSVSIDRCIYRDGRLAIIYPTKDRPRKVQTFVDHAKGNAEAERIARDLHNGGAEAQIFTSADRADLAQAKKDVAPFAIPVHVATSQWAAEQMEILGGGFARADVIKAGLVALKRTPHPTPEIIAEFTASMAPKDLHGRTRRGLINDLAKFGEAFPVDMRTIRAGQIEEFLDGRIDQASGKRVGGWRDDKGTLVGSRRRDNILGEIRQLFQFARIRSYISDELNEARKIDKIHKLSGSITFFAIAELHLMFEHVTPEWLPYLVSTTLAGARSEEAALSKDATRRKDPLRWEDFCWEEREIYVRPETSKTGKERKMPILDHAFAYLQQFRGCTGPISPIEERPDREFGRGGRLEKRINRALADAPRLLNAQPVQLQMESIAPAPVQLLTSFEWRQNAHRHTYGSYRGSQIRNMNQLSEEMGNSPGMCRRHYHNPRPASHVRAWSAMRPVVDPVIVPFLIEKTA